MELQRVMADDREDVAVLTGALNASLAAWEHPWTPHRMAMSIRHGWDGEPGRWFLCRADGAVVGQLGIFTSDYDNLDLAWLWLGILPERRREGLGTAALDAAYDVCQGLGRTLLGIAGWEGPRTEGFATATGFERRSVAVCRRLHLADADLAAMAEIARAAAAHAGDFELIRLSGHTPDELLPGLAELTGAINDAPLDGLELEDEQFPVERIRAYETAQLASGFRFRRLVARHRGSGALAGHTVVTVDAEQPWIGHQHDTAVARDHRGHRLGLLLKAAMVGWLAEEEPQLATIDTYNAESNTHMVGVNEALGYRPVGREGQYQRRI